MNIRPARESELPRLMELFDIARAYMRRNGNTVQWVNGYPSEDLIRQDIAQDRAFVVEEAGIAEAVFCYLTGRHVEPTYAVIHGGAWPDDAPYGVIHRLASSGKLRGVMGLCADWALSRCPVLRVDTHESNATMRAAMARLGFTECGTIILGDETPRIAFQKRRDCLIRECRTEEDFRAAGAVLSEAWQASMASAARISWPGIRRRSGRSTWRPEADRENGSSPLRTAVKHLALSVFAAARSGTSTFCRRPRAWAMAVFCWTLPSGRRRETPPSGSWRTIVPPSASMRMPASPSPAGKTAPASSRSGR